MCNIPGVVVDNTTAFNMTAMPPGCCYSLLCDIECGSELHVCKEALEVSENFHVNLKVFKDLKKWPLWTGCPYRKVIKVIQFCKMGSQINCSL